MQLEFVLTKWTGEVTLPVCGRMTSSLTDWQHWVLELMCEPVWERDTCLLFSLDSAITGAIKIWRLKSYRYIHGRGRFWLGPFDTKLRIHHSTGPALIPMCNIKGNIYTEIYQSFPKFSLLKNFTVTSTFTGNKGKSIYAFPF